MKTLTLLLLLSATAHAAAPPNLLQDPARRYRTGLSRQRAGLALSVMGAIYLTIGLGLSPTLRGCYDCGIGFPVAGIATLIAGAGTLAAGIPLAVGGKREREEGLRLLGGVPGPVPEPRTFERAWQRKRVGLQLLAAGGVFATLGAVGLTAFGICTGTHCGEQTLAVVGALSSAGTLPLAAILFVAGGVLYERGRRELGEGGGVADVRLHLGMQPSISMRF